MTTPTGGLRMLNTIDLQLGRRLRRRRRAMGLTQRQLGLLCGVTFQQIQKYETATNRMSASTIWNLARALEVDVSYFFDNLAGEARAQAAVEPRPEAFAAE